MLISLISIFYSLTCLNGQPPAGSRAAIEQIMAGWSTALTCVYVDPQFQNFPCNPNGIDYFINFVNNNIKANFKFITPGFSTNTRQELIDAVITDPEVNTVDKSIH